MPQVAEEAPPKYVVYPAGNRGGRLHREQPLEQGTYFVIRDTDIIGLDALYSYLSSVQTVLAMDNRPGRAFLKSEEREELERLEDYLTNLSTEWARSGKGRLPS